MRQESFSDKFGNSAKFSLAAVRSAADWNKPLSALLVLKCNKRFARAAATTLWLVVEIIFMRSVQKESHHGI